MPVELELFQMVLVITSVLSLLGEAYVAYRVRTVSDFVMQGEARC